MIKALIFDCFGVFYADPVFAYMRDPQTPPDKAKALHSLDEQTARGTLGKEGFVAQAAELLNITHEAAEQRFFQSTNRNEQLTDLVKQLCQHYKICLLSNIGADMMDGFFSPAEREELFDEAILSGAVKMAKPDREIFELACQKLGVELDEAIMIDDMQNTCDIVKMYGMKSICYKDFGQFSSELREMGIMPESMDRKDTAQRNLPPIIKQVGFDFHWDERKVWALNVPTEDIPIEELTWHFDIPFWSKPGGFYDLCAKDVIAHPDQYREEYERTLKADTSHPIDIMFWKGRYVILDGLHRLARQFIEGKELVAVRKITEADIPKIEKVVIPHISKELQ